MKDPNRRIITMQWIVIAVLIIGAGIGVYILLSQNNQLEAQQATNAANMSSLQNQLKEAKASPTPFVTPLPEASNNLASPTPTPTPTATPKATVTPKSSSNQ